MRWEIIVTWESCNHLGGHLRSYTVDSLSQALKEKSFIYKHEPTATVTIKRVKQ